MNIYDYIKNLYTKGRIFATSVEIKARDDHNKLINMFFNSWNIFKLGLV